MHTLPHIHNEYISMHVCITCCTSFYRVVGVQEYSCSFGFNMSGDVYLTNTNKQTGKQPSSLEQFHPPLEDLGHWANIRIINRRGSGVY